MVTKKVTMSLTPKQQEKARSLSKDLFGKENISGLVGFLIERWEKEQKTSTNLQSAVADKKIDLIKEYLEPTGITIRELIERNAYSSLCQLLDAYLLEAVRNCR